MSELTEQLFIRAIIGLCALGQGATQSDVRDQVHDMVAVAVRLSLRQHLGGSQEQLRLWCQDALRLMEYFAKYQLFSDDSAARTQVVLLRLMHSLPKEVSAPVPAKRVSVGASAPKEKTPLTENQKKVIAVVREHAPARTQQVIDRLSGVMSERSVLRTLKELVSAKQIGRTKDLGSVRYEVASVAGALTAEKHLL